MDHDLHSRKRLGPGAVENFAGDRLFERVARAVCKADALPRKELYESWEVARRVRRRLRGGRTVDLACGHGLVAQLMTLIDKSSEGALAVDAVVPASAAKLAASLGETWPFLLERVRVEPGDLERVPLLASDVVVSIHACGSLTDRVLARAMEARARVAVLPCCHAHGRAPPSGLEGWLEPALAIDVERAERLRRAGYRVYTQAIPATITPKNRLLMAEPIDLPPAPR